MLGGQRTMFLASSVAVVMVGFSATFENPMASLTIKIIAAVIFALCIYIGIKSTLEFEYYMRTVKDQLPSYIPYKSWMQWSYVSYIYSAILVAISILYFIFRIKTLISLKR